LEIPVDFEVLLALGLFLQDGPSNPL
jgi:hypothetical protein